MSKKGVYFVDTTFRDGAQSLWAMKMTRGMYEAVAAEMDQGGFKYIELPAHALYMQMMIRFYKEDPWKTMHMFNRKMPDKHIYSGCGFEINLLRTGEPRSLVRLWNQTVWNAIGSLDGSRRTYSMTGTRNEIDRILPWAVPMIREFGMTYMPAICYYPSKRHTDEYYADYTKRLMTEVKPDALMLKDAGGLLTVERIKTLLPAIQKEAKGIPIELHTHGMSTNSGRVVVEAMVLGIDGIQTCVPPLANGSSHTSIFNAVHNAKILGIETNMNEKPLRVVEERLTRIAKLENLPIGVPLEYDHGVYTHQVPGGVISNLKNQLGILGIPHKLDEVLEEVVRMLDELGNPIMITPMSQFVVSQAAVNVATGERWKEILDCMIETALGVWGWEDAGVPWMDPNLKDRLLSHPNAKRLEAKYKMQQEMAEQEIPIKKLKSDLGIPRATDEEFLLHWIMQGDEEIKKMREEGGKYKTYYTGKEPLVLLLKELSKDRDISRLHLQRGKSFFEFRRK